jgi:hypothetical protein
VHHLSKIGGCNILIYIYQIYIHKEREDGGKGVEEDSGKFYFGKSNIDMPCTIFALTHGEGSDSGPYPMQSKKGTGHRAAGCFT